MRKFLLVILLAIINLAVVAQNAAEIKLALKKLNTLGSVMYLAAHPDDENTRLIAYFSNEQMINTSYLSLTRGDGGQNLIGTERSALMGVLRTQELLEARKIDGGQQFFTRAVDFGFSKTAEESFEIWNKNEVLSDVVFAIRKFKPDIIVTRFPTSNYNGHGHHKASAILAAEAFDLAADTNAFPEHFTYTTTWQPKSLFLNASTWWDKSLPEKAAQNDDYFTIDVGKYNTLLGKSYTEIAAESRTMHKSQGFGAEKVKGEQIEYLLFLKGNKPQKNIFDNINLTWSKIKGGEVIESLINKAINEYNEEQPHLIVPILLEVYEKVLAMPDNHWRFRKLIDVKEVIFNCLGLHYEFTTTPFYGTEGEKITAELKIVNRSPLSVHLEKIMMFDKDSTVNISLLPNQQQTIKTNFRCKDAHFTNPFWLNEPYQGLFSVPSKDMVNRPSNEFDYRIAGAIKIEDKTLYFVTPLYQKTIDRVKGEVFTPFIVLPKVAASISEKVVVFNQQAPKKVIITVKAHQNNVNGTLSLDLPKDWKVTPTSHQYAIKDKNKEQKMVFTIIPEKNATVSNLKVMLNEQVADEVTYIDYDHIKRQTIIQSLTAKLVPVDVKITGKKVGYIMGAGDEVPAAIEQMGFEVELLNEEKLKLLDLSVFDAIVCGVRAYNTNDYLVGISEIINQYVANGGNFVVQYNVSRGLVTDEIGPVKFVLDRDRVTEEDAEVHFLNENHVLLNYPNKLTKKDFNGWIQERGLYFASEWDDAFVPILSMNDQNETAKKGSLIVAKYGKGSVIYTGLSFFRELPEGIPGAYRLFANILSYTP